MESFCKGLCWCVKKCVRFWMHNVMNVLLLIIMYTVYAHVKMKRCNSVNTLRRLLYAYKNTCVSSGVTSNSSLYTIIRWLREFQVSLPTSKVRWRGAMGVEALLSSSSNVIFTLASVCVRVCNKCVCFVCWGTHTHSPVDNNY